MDPQRWVQIDRVLQEALDQPPEDREAFVCRAAEAAGDPALAGEVLSLLAQAPATNGFLEPRPAASAPPLRPGQSFGSYTIDALIGVGGMGQVYRAHDSRLGRDVAIKTLPAEVNTDADRRARFEREARTVAAISHPNIVAVHDVGTVEDVTFLVMELLEGETLRQRLNQVRPAPTPSPTTPAPGTPAPTAGSSVRTRRRGLPVQKALDIAAHIALGLAAAHARGIVHRDLKPENIFLTTDGRVKVLDFGLARATATTLSEAETRTTPQEAGRTQPGMVLGTLGYMAPEQVRGREADSRADIFALGAVLYEMLTGARAFAADSAIETMGAILNTDPLERRDLTATLPPAVETLVRHCLEKQPEERFQSASDLAFQLHALATGSLGSGIAAAPPLPGPKRIWRIGYAAVLLLLAGMAAWGWSQPRAVPADQEPFFLPLRIDNPPRSRSPWSRGIALSPDGSRLAYRGSGGWYLLDIREGTTSLIPTSGGLALEFSPAGDEVAISRTGRIQPIDVVNLKSGQRRRLVDCCFGLSDWDSNGWLYHTDLKNNLVRTNVDGRSEVVDLPLSADHWPNQQARASHSGRVVIFVRKPEKGSAPDSYRVVAKELATGREKELGAAADAFPTMSGHVLLIKADGTALAAPLDEASLSLKGDPVPVLRNVEIKVRGSGNTPEAALALSRSGTLAYVSRAEPSRDTVVTVDRQKKQVGDPIEWPGWLNDLDYFPDGRQIASMHPGLFPPNVFVRTTPQAEPRRLTFSDNLDYDPLFIPNSSDVVYVGSTEGKNWDLYRVPFDGGAKPSLILDLEGDISNPRVTADGKWVVFHERGLGGGNTVMAVELGAKAAPITLATGSSPDVSPDGRWLAYVATDSGGASQIWVRPFPKPGETVWQVSTAGGTSPVWASNGRELFYVNGSRELVALPVTTGPTFRFESPRTLFKIAGDELWTREVLPGDQRFLLIKRKLEAPGQVVMIRNFFELLRQKVGR